MELGDQAFSDFRLIQYVEGSHRQCSRDCFAARTNHRLRLTFEATLRDIMTLRVLLEQSSEHIIVQLLPFVVGCQNLCYLLVLLLYHISIKEAKQVRISIRRTCQNSNIAPASSDIHFTKLIGRA